MQFLSRLSRVYHLLCSGNLLKYISISIVSLLIKRSLHSFAVSCFNMHQRVYHFQLPGFFFQMFVGKVGHYFIQPASGKVLRNNFFALLPNLRKASCTISSAAGLCFVILMATRRSGMGIRHFEC